MNLTDLPGAGPDSEAPSGADDTTTTSLLAELNGGGGDLTLAGTGDGKKLPTRAIFVAVVFMLSGAVLFFMRQHGMGPGLAVADLQIDYDVEGKQNLTADHGEVLTSLEQSVKPPQVPVEDIQKNPFYLPEVEADAPAPGEDPSDALARRLAEQAAEREAHMLGVLESLELHGVLGGSRPVARLNGMTMRVGDTVDETFIITAIESRSIILEAVDGDEEFELPMGVNPFAQQKRR